MKEMNAISMSVEKAIGLDIRLIQMDKIEEPRPQDFEKPDMYSFQVSLGQKMAESDSIPAPPWVESTERGTFKIKLGWDSYFAYKAVGKTQIYVCVF